MYKSVEDALTGLLSLLLLTCYILWDIIIVNAGKIMQEIYQAIRSIRNP